MTTTPIEAARPPLCADNAPSMMKRSSNPANYRGQLVLTICLLLSLRPCLVRAQAVATTQPAPPTSMRDSVSILFDATRGDGGLATFTGDVYVHAGVLTLASTSTTDWKYAQGPWGAAVPRLKMTALGNHLYRLRIRPDTFFGLPPGEIVKAFVFVFRSADGSKSGRETDGSDVVLPLSSLTHSSAGQQYASHQWQGGVLTVSTTGGATLTVQPYAAGVARVAFYPAGTPAVAAPSFAVVAAPEAAISSGATLAEEPERLTLTTTNLRIELNKNPLRLTYRRGPDADTLLSETAGGYFEGMGQRNQRGLRFGLKTGEELYGTGSRALPTNRRGQRVQLYNQAHYGYQYGQPNLNISIPLVLSSRGYGLFFDDTQPGYLDLGRQQVSSLEFGTENTRLTYFVFTQPNLPGLLAAYTNLTGHQPLPPRWALGYIQSKYGYQTETEARNIVAGLRAQDFPLSALVLDLYWFGNPSRMGDLDWDRTRFPNPTGMLRDFQTQGVQTILIAEPYITRQSRNFAATQAGNLLARTSTGAPYVLRGFWAGDAGLLDMSNPATHAWLWPFYRARIQEGVAGWWSDLGEPETHPDDMQHLAGPARTVHNVFSNQWAELLQTSYRREFPDQRLFNLTRSGFAGMQRLGGLPWSGDVQRSWGGLQAQVPIMLGMGLSGVGYMHADAGGFTGGGQDNELYTRWLQFAVFTPLMRAHGEGVPTEPIYYPEPYKSIVRDYAHLRHRLLPYTYTLAWENSQTGQPLARPLHFNEPLTGGNGQSALSDAYFWGPDLLVAPVLQPGQRQRTVRLPGSTPWLSFWDHTSYAAGGAATVPAPLAQLPLFVRAGAVLPMRPYAPSATYAALDTLELRCYPDPAVATAHAQVYDDDGHTPDTYAAGQYQLFDFQTTTTPNGDYTLVATSTGAGFRAAPARRVLWLAVQRVAQLPALLTLNSRAVPLFATPAAFRAAPDSAAYYDVDAKELQLRLPWNPRRTSTVRLGSLALATRGPAAPGSTTLNSPYPNPFSQSTTLSAEVVRAGTHTFRVYSVTGQLIWQQAVKTNAAGPIITQWPGISQTDQPQAPGVYIIEMAGQHQRVVLLR